MKCGREQYTCGVVCLFTHQTSSQSVANSISNEVASGDFQFALIHFSRSAYKPEVLVTMMRDCAPDLQYASCSTAGEITPLGLVEGEMVILLFPKMHFKIEARAIAKRDDANMETVITQIASFKESFLLSNRDHRENKPFAICLMDGMTHMEEAITAALYWGLDDIPLLGGSAGDDMNFSDTSLILNGKIIDSHTIVIMINSNLPTQIFKTDNFIPTAEKLVVTRSDPEQRIVFELNGAPAARTYADVIGTDPNSLTPQSFASHPLVMRVGGEFYCRSIQKVNDDNSLSFFCAIDDGIVLTVAEPKGMVRTTQASMEKIKSTLGSIDFILGFDCVLRRIDARNRQITHEISDRKSVV